MVGGREGTILKGRRILNSLVLLVALRRDRLDLFQVLHGLHGFQGYLGQCSNQSVSYSVHVFFVLFFFRPFSCPILLQVLTTITADFSTDTASAVTAIRIIRVFVAVVFFHSFQHKLNLSGTSSYCVLYLSFFVSFCFLAASFGCFLILFPLLFFARRRRGGLGS